MLTFHRSQTPSCFYPNGAALSFPASQLHFCCLHSTSSLLLSEHCLSWRDSIHLGGWEETNIEKKNLKPTTKETATAWSCPDTSSICRSSWGNGWVGLNQTEQSKENGLHYLALPFTTGQGHSTCSRGRQNLHSCRCLQGCALRGQPVAVGNTVKEPLQSCRVNHTSGCLILVSLSA